jgi:homeobox protein 2
MHRKSIEAAEQLKDDGCNSDKEDQHETSSMATDKSDNSGNNSSPPQQQQQQHLNHNAVENNKEMHQIRLQELQHQIEHQNHQSSGLQLSHATDPEEFRNNSIACLRAKAQEHSAKILSLSADAVMLVNRATTSASASAASHCDTTANSLAGRQHQGDVLLTSSDNSSSIF